VLSTVSDPSETPNPPRLGRPQPAVVRSYRAPTDKTDNDDTDNTILTAGASGVAAGTTANYEEGLNGARAGGAPAATAGGRVQVRESPLTTYWPESSLSS